MNATTGGFVTKNLSKSLINNEGDMKKIIFILIVFSFIFFETKVSHALPQFDSLVTCQLSDDPNILTTNCTDDEPDEDPLPDLYDGTENTRYLGDFGAEYFRITTPSSAIVENPTVNSMYPDYAKVSAWNSNSTRLWVFDNRGYIHLYDGDTYARIERITTDWESSGQDQEPRWSHSDPNILYYISGMNFNSYNISSHVTTLLHSFTDSDFGVGVSGCENIHNGDEGNSDDSDRYWAFYCQTGSPGYNQKGLLVYDLLTDTILASKTYQANGICGTGICPTTINWIGISHTGEYVLINWNDDASDNNFSIRGTGQEVFNKNLNYISKSSEKNWHTDVAQMADGTEVFVGASHLGDVNGYKAIRMVRLSDGVVIKNCMFPENTSGYHISARTNGSLLKGWVLYSTYNQGGTGIIPGIFNMENFALNIDTCEVKRIVHNQSVHNT